MSSYVGIHIRDQSLQSQLMQIELRSLESKFDSLKNQNGKVMAGDLPPLMVKIKAFIEMYSEEEIRGILSGLDSDFSDKIDLNPSLRSCESMLAWLLQCFATFYFAFKCYLSKNLFTINPGTLSACITSEKSSSMAVDAAIETLSPPFHSPSHFSPQRNFYLAVDRLHFMMDTLMDLLGLAGRRSGLPMVVCCSSRDELDAVCSAVANVPFISLASLYTDLAEADCSLILEHFRQATMRWNPEVSVQPAVDSASVKDEQKSHMIVATDACLPLLAPGESPIAARVLINYELPTKKETYTRRMTTFLAGDGIVINMVVGG
ncbi:uncharacterized protein LOC126584356 [Malus sylvestris]|uniref:uncharacterized protein LOC126584356 n=1 Tax=Malus sylvestris TaxID=3752 RepID=UPI0021AC7E1A|nr:uncharacterized protein LOC126584356 [Malus sylvestris]